MKKLLVISISLLCMSSLFAQQYSEEELRTKLSRALKMKHTGQGFVIAGVGVSIVGIGFMVWGANEGPSFSSAAGEEAMRKYILGAMVAVVGEVGIGIGIPFWIAGGKRSNHYNHLLKDFDNQLSFKITNRGFGLHYSF